MLKKLSFLNKKNNNQTNKKLKTKMMNKIIKNKINNKTIFKINKKSK